MRVGGRPPLRHSGIQSEGPTFGMASESLLGGDSEWLSVAALSLGPEGEVADLDVLQLRHDSFRAVTTQVVEQVDRVPACAPKADLHDPRPDIRRAGIDRHDTCVGFTWSSRQGRSTL